MKYSVKFAHLEKPSPFKVGQKVHRGDYLGNLGNTGVSRGRHLHTDEVEGHIPTVWTLSNMEHGIVTPALKQLNYFLIDNEMFGGHKFTVTAFYGDYRYKKKVKINDEWKWILQIHLGYDIILKIKGVWKFFWPRSYDGTILFNDFHNGYGNTLIIGYEIFGG